jgi:hypothetical protein
LALPVVLALAVALLRGGSLAGWSEQRIRWWPLALFALAVQIPAYGAPIGAWLPADIVGPLCTVLTTALVLAMILRNAVGAARPACLLAATGVILNLTVIVANDGLMPRADALAPRPLGRSELSSTPNNTAPSGPATRLAWLGDTIAQPGWLPLANLVSIGDVFLSFGAAYWAYEVTRRRAARAQIVS